MANMTVGRFPRRGPDVVTEELAVLLCGSARFEFKPFFKLVHAKLRARNMANGKEEMLHLRVYEKLHDLVRKGMVDKITTAGIKEYLGLASLATALPVLPLTKVVGDEDRAFRLRPVWPAKTSRPCQATLVRTLRSQEGDRDAAGENQAFYASTK